MLKLVLIFEFCIRMKLSSSNANFRGYLNVKQLLLCLKCFWLAALFLDFELHKTLCVCCQDILQNPQCTKAAVFTPDKAKGRHSCIEAYATNKFFFWASRWVKWNFDTMLGIHPTKMCISLDMAWTSWIIPSSPGSIHETITFANWKAPIQYRQEGSPAAECRTSLESSVQRCPG